MTILGVFWPVVTLGAAAVFFPRVVLAFVIIVAIAIFVDWLTTEDVGDTQWTVYYLGVWMMPFFLFGVIAGWIVQSGIKRVRA